MSDKLIQTKRDEVVRLINYYYSEPSEEFEGEIVDRIMSIFNSDSQPNAVAEPQELKELKKIRNYFGENDVTPFEHWAYKYLDDFIIKQIESQPQPVSETGKYLFGAKRKMDGKWIEGSLLQENDGTDSIYHYNKHGISGTDKVISGTIKPLFPEQPESKEFCEWRLNAASYYSSCGGSVGVEHFTEGKYKNCPNPYCGKPIKLKEDAK